MALKKSLMILSLIPLASCGLTAKELEPRVVSQPVLIEREIPIQPRPRGVTLSDIKWRVVTHENVDAFIEEISLGGDKFVFMAIAVKDYEKMALNLDELRRYIEQQKEIIVYYEESVKPRDSVEETEPQES